MAGTYTLTGMGAGHSGHSYPLSRTEVERLVGSRTDGTYRICNVVTRKCVTVSDKRPLTDRDIDRISNTDVVKPTRNPNVAGRFGHYGEGRNG